MKSLRRSFAAVAAICIMSAAAFAADPSGTYTFTGGFGGGGRGPGGGAPGGGAPGGGAPGGGTPPVSTLVLALKDGKLTGSVTSAGRNGEQKIDITDASVKDDTVTFSTSQPGRDGGAPRVTKYTGKITADAITGTVTRPGRGDAAPVPAEWMAKKSK